MADSVPPTPDPPRTRRPRPGRPAQARVIALLAVAVAFTSFGLVAALERLAPDAEPTVRLFAPGAGAGFRGYGLPEPFAAPAIDLPTADGDRFVLADTRGEAVLLFFGYTRCPDVCPQTLAKLTAALAELGELAEPSSKRAGVRVAFITVDPAYDTADVVRNYLADYDPRIVGLVGDGAALKAVADAYDVAAGPVPTPASGLVAPGDHAAGDDHGAHDAPAAGGTPQVAHSSTVFLIDPAGQLRAVLGAESSPADIAHDVRLVLEGP